MNRLGWIVLGLIVALGAAFAALQSPGGIGAPVHVASESAGAPAREDMTIPVSGVANEQLVDSWHDAREGGARVHEALDIVAARGTPVVAAMAGTVEKLFVSKRGGNTVYVRSGDWMAYYAHLAAYYPGIVEGMTVRRGQQIGFVGDTGNAGAGNYHLHFALNRVTPAQKWYEGTPVNPYPSLAGKASAR